MPASDADKADTERVVRILLAILYSVKNHLRAEWGAPLRSLEDAAMMIAKDGRTMTSEFSDLLPSGMKVLEDEGLGLPLQLTFFVDLYIRRGYEKGWFHAPQSSALSTQLNTLVDAYGRMETIRSTPLPIAHL